MADTPEAFDVIVMPNLYGDILSDVAAQITGSVGLAGSANIGDGFAMFEAIHGSAPRIADMNKANPSGLLLAAVQMLVHINQKDVAEKVQNAWLKTIEDGVHTYDIFKEDVSKQRVGTDAFADAVIERLGQKPATLKPVNYADSSATIKVQLKERKPVTRQLVGIDVFLNYNNRNANELGAELEKIQVGNIKLNMISNRGAKVYPNGFPETFCTDHWRCRFVCAEMRDCTYQTMLHLQQQITQAGFEIIKTENLYLIDGIPGYSAGQGQ